MSQSLTWIAIVLGILAVLFVVQFIHLSVILYSEDQKTVGLGYYGRPLAERDQFKRWLRRHALILFPVIRLMGKLSRFTFAKASFQHRGIAGPKGTCSKESFERADQYQARPEDVFVATQMKCGTTWMQQVVYEVLRRGDGDLVESGKAMYGVSAWLEARKSVPVDQAPLIGSERPSRIIKTHLPAELCPRSAESKYIYVVRHPVSCFASCIDFLATNVGPFMPTLDAVEEWFRSDQLMWWGTWPKHVKGWWELSHRSANVLFVSFEEMKKDLPGIVRKVASFLGVKPLSDSELARVVEKSGFNYMRKHKDNFEMHPPHILAIDARLFVRGSADRHKDVPEASRERIRHWCAEQMRGGSFPLAKYYPDVA